MFKKKAIKFFILTGQALILSACAASQEVAPPEENMDDNMTVDINFTEIHRCSRISPEIKIYEPPKGTKFYDVRLMEEGTIPRYLGGGTWDEDGSGIIPEGGLTRHYSGPCPPVNQEVEYVYIISAMENAQGQPLEVRLYRFKP